MSRSSAEYELLPSTVAENRPAWMESPVPEMESRNGLHAFLRPLGYRLGLVLLGFLLLLSISSIVIMRNFLGLQAAVSFAGNSYDSDLDKLWPVALPNRTDDWENENSKSMRALMNCIASNSCGPNQKSIVVLSESHFAGSIAGAVAGEDIWAASVMDALKQLGYTMIFAPRDTDNIQLAATYRQFPDLIKVIITQGFRAKECFKDRRCIKTKDNPLGVPAWKMLSFHFWTGSENALGNAWTLSPENYSRMGVQHSMENVYLGYSIEHKCTQIPTTPFEDRPRQAYILAKKREYFGADYSWTGIDLSNPPFDISFLVGVRQQGNELTAALPVGIKDLGTLNKSTFYYHVSHSRVLLGIGKPLLSPSPYDALCMGVPFINPIHGWDKNDPENRAKWSAQHGGLQYLDPPYVYNVKKHDEKGLWDALQSAMNTPIDRFIVPEMTMEALKSRVHGIVETDWRGKAERLLETRKQTGKGELFEL